MLNESQFNPYLVPAQNGNIFVSSHALRMSYPGAWGTQVELIAAA